MNYIKLKIVKAKIIVEVLNKDKVKILLKPQSHEDSESVEIIDIGQHHQSAECGKSQSDPPAKRRKLSQLLDVSRPKEATFLGNDNCGLTPKQKISGELERYCTSKPLSLTLMPLLWCMD